MTPGTQSPFFLLLLLTVLTVVTGSGHASSTPGGEKETSATQRSSMPSSTEKNAFNSSLEDPSTNYYQELQRDISELFLQIYKQGGFLGCSNIKFSLGLGCQAGASRCWCWSVFWLRWPSSISLPWLSVSAAERTTGSWTSFQPGMPTIL
ncbi:MUC1 isoform 18 [Pongo abelii]|uniref:MUC1 isoform 18 n=1 Tax=Pongo abelii TaxID=9601 RepID=A0A2J8VGB1_PONAB|nr:MUC1 isoform 18 [Pongo abelii]